MKNTLLSVCTAHLGTDASPNDVAPDELGCAETVTALLQKIYPETPIITGTYTLYEYLNNSPKYQKINEPEPEAIIISPTGMGNLGTNGHVGIFMEDGLIASNDSRTGKFLQNYTFETWKSYYGKRGYPTFLFKRVV